MDEKMRIELITIQILISVKTPTTFHKPPVEPQTIVPLLNPCDYSSTVRRTDRPTTGLCCLTVWWLKVKELVAVKGNSEISIRCEGLKLGIFSAAFMVDM